MKTGGEEGRCSMFKGMNRLVSAFQASDKLKHYCQVFWLEQRYVSPVTLPCWFTGHAVLTPFYIYLIHSAVRGVRCS